MMLGQVVRHLPAFRLPRLGRVPAQRRQFRQRPLAQILLAVDVVNEYVDPDGEVVSTARSIGIAFGDGR